MLQRVFRISKNALALNTNRPTFLKTVHSTLRIKKNDLSHPRFSVVVSKKIDKRAVGRNFLRRRAYQAVLPLISMLGGYDIVISLKKEAEKIPESLLQEELHNVLRPFLTV